MEGLAGAKLGAATIATMQTRLATYAYPRIGHLEVQTIDATVRADLLRPNWTSKPETALRVRQAIIRILRFLRPDGHLLENSLAEAVSDRLPKLPDSQHHAAMPHTEAPAFWRKLAAKETKGFLAL
ncbi:phage integrase central domain-containing protein [Novosphingobium sp.]|uniref:phage integrase central domain-containing protein n=1 Tax=Novosphingobium sp. TaxID=1874826 RepID=UPI002FDDC1B8